MIVAYRWKNNWGFKKNLKYSKNKNAQMFSAKIQIWNSFKVIEYMFSSYMYFNCDMEKMYMYMYHQMVELLTHVLLGIFLMYRSI